MPKSQLVALACCRITPDAAGTDLYPDPDSELLAERIESLGYQARLVAWDDPAVDWAQFGSVVLRSTWDGIDRPDEYLSWVRHVHSCANIHNPLGIIEWNLDKRYLRGLAASGVPTVPTQWVAPGQGWNEPHGEFIVKPALASGARNTARYSIAALEAAQTHISMLGELGQTALVQDYLPSVESQGETSIIFIAGQVSHAIRKGGFLNLDEGILDQPWERMTYLGPTDPTWRQINVAEHAFGVVQDLGPDPILYGRVDLIDNPSGQPVVLEIELIDPNLSLKAVPSAADKLTSAIVKLL